MKIFLLIILTLPFFDEQAQTDSYIKEIEMFQKNLNEEFLNPEESPLSKKEMKKFTTHNYFQINESFRIVAKFVKVENPESFQMKTTTARLPTYDKYGEAIFEIEGKEYKLNIYQSHSLRETEKYKEYLFLPFTDLTNGDETYGGGRYIDLNIVSSDTIIIDFNKAYTPSCAYNHNYSCPIPPKENDLLLRIEAGVKNLDL